MVGIKKLANINMSSFIGIAYKILFDFINGRNSSQVFKLHFLGIYQRQERFQIAFMEQLFRSYFNGIVGTLFTYDSINYIRQVQKGAAIDVHDLHQGDLYVYPLKDTPREIIETVYWSEIFQNAFYSELERKRAGRKLSDTNVFAPLSIYSNITIDRLFEYVIDKYDIIDTFTKCISAQHVEFSFNKIFKALKSEYPLIFTPAFSKALIRNLKITLKFHQWYLNKRDEKSLHQLILSFIKLFNISNLLTL